MTKRLHHPFLMLCLMLAITVVLVPLRTHAQYSLTASSGTYVPLGGGIALDAIETDEGSSAIIPLGFTFTYFGADYTSVIVSANGMVTFDTSPMGFSYDNSKIMYGVKAVAPLWDDLSGDGGQATYRTDGSPGSRVFTVEWQNWKWPFSASSASISFQCRLYEGTNAIAFTYRQEAGTVGDGSASIGLSGSQRGHFFTLANTGASPSLDPNGGVDLGTRPATGQVYTFRPSAVASVGAPTVQASNVTATQRSSATEMVVNWTSGNGAYRLVFVKVSSAPESIPSVTNGNFFSGNSRFRDGDGSGGWYCIYNGAGSSATVFGLQSSATYRVQVVEYNGVNGRQQYLTSTATQNPVSYSAPTIAPTTSTRFKMQMATATKGAFAVDTRGNGLQYLIFVKEGRSTTGPTLVDNQVYTANATFRLGSQAGTSGWYCVYRGSSNFTELCSGLTPGTTYTAWIAEANGFGGTAMYLVSPDANAYSKVFTTLPSSLPVTYAFAATTAPFTPLTGGVDVDAIEGDDYVSAGIPLGFTFYVGGVPFTNVTASSNGFLSFGGFPASNPDNSFYRMEPTPVLAPYWDDMSGSAGTAKYQTSGTAPNRVFTMEFLNWRHYRSGVTTDEVSMQVRLYEADNRFEYAYRRETASPIIASASIGFSYFNPSDEVSFYSLTSAGASPTIDQTTSSNFIADLPATNQVYSFTPNKSPQTITFATLANSTYGDRPFQLTATASSGLPVTFVSSNSAVATVSGNTVTIVGAGSTNITASQGGSLLYSSTTAVQPLTVNKASQTITFLALAPRGYGESPYALTGTASSGLPLTYTSSNTAVATTSGNIVTLVGIGTTTITASQAGSANYNAAASVNEVLQVNKGIQTITFAPLPTKAYGDSPFELTATASSGLAVTYTSSNIAVATVTGNVVTIVGVGTTTITAEQAGNNVFGATRVLQQLTVQKASQTITMQPPTVTMGDEPFTLEATASSGLPVRYSTASDKISLQGNVVTVLQAGSVVIHASQAGNAFYQATTVDLVFCVNPTQPSITLTTTNGELLLTTNAAEGVQWYKNASAIAGATQAFYNATEAGTYTVTATTEGCTSAVSDAQVIVVTGIEQRSTNGIDVYPNPVTSLLHVDFSAGKSFEIKLIDASGKLLTRTSGRQQATLSTEHLQAGEYLLLLRQDDKTIVRKIFKQ